MSIANDPAKKNFLRNLAETIAWCQPRAAENDPRLKYQSESEWRSWLESLRSYEHDQDDLLKYVLRSEALRPPVKAGDWNDDGISFWIDQVKMAEYVIAERRRLLTETSTVSVYECQHLSVGRLLAYYMGYSLHDGMASHETAYFFDIEDTPPWDTWVDFVTVPRCPTKTDVSSLKPIELDELLIAWIPPEYTELVQQGVDTQPLEILNWVDDPRPNRVSHASMLKWLATLFK
ncbi:MAG: hypothetical protein O7F76_08030 [Planctomycetota bacterium]|nr:hypothetical protein [Planctomycetota bacterium]